MQVNFERQKNGVAIVGIAERIYEIVKGLPEASAAEVLDYAQAKCVKSAAGPALAARRASALAVLDKHAGHFKSVKLDRAALHDRASVR
jgi:hypothetical protein